MTKPLNALERAVLLFSRLLAKVEDRGARIEGRVVLNRLQACGEGVGIWGRIRITGAEKVSLGDNVHIGDNAFIRGEGGLTIGSNTHISRNLVLYTVNHRFEGLRLPYDDELVRKSVVIGENVWIGMNCCITPGATIGDGAIIGMGTVVSGEVPRLAIIGGEKWRVLGHRDEGLYDRLRASGEFGGPSGMPWSKSANASEASSL